MFIKYYYLSLLFITFLIQSFGYIHLIERTIASFEEKPIHAKSCQNCKYFIENENYEFSRCSKFMKPKNRNRSVFGEEYTPPLVMHIKASYDDKNTAIVLFYLARTCRNNETMCGADAKHYQRKFCDFY
jgi:hypothetical protein